MPAGDRWVDHRGGRKEPSASAVTAGRSLAGGGGSRFRGLLSPGALSSRPAGPPTSGRLDVSEHTDGSVAMGPRLGLWGEVVTGDSGKAGGGRGGLGRGVASASVPLQPCQTPPPPAPVPLCAGGRGGKSRLAWHQLPPEWGAALRYPSNDRSALTTLQTTLTRLGDDLASNPGCGALNRQPGLAGRGGLRSLGSALGAVPTTPVAPCSHSTGSTCACNSLPTGEIARRRRQPQK